MGSDNANLPSSVGGSVSAALVPCPFCAEHIQPAAKKCRHCGEYLDDSIKPKTPSQSLPPLFAPQPSGAAAASSSASTTVVVHGNRGMNHALHILLCFVTFGVWIPFYILIAVIHGFGKR